MDEDRREQRRRVNLPGLYKLVTWAGIRDAVLFVSGLVLLVRETITGAPERPTLLLMFAAMMGLPALLRGGNGR